MYQPGHLEREWDVVVIVLAQQVWYSYSVKAGSCFLFLLGGEGANNSFIETQFTDRTVYPLTVYN